MAEWVEGFYGEEEWKRACSEINKMERHIANLETVMLKFWLQVDHEEQLKRFEERQQNKFRQRNITEEDWQNWKKWDQSRVVVKEMLSRVCTLCAPWIIGSQTANITPG